MDPALWDLTHQGWLKDSYHGISNVSATEIKTDVYRQLWIPYLMEYLIGLTCSHTYFGKYSFSHHYSFLKSPVFQPSRANIIVWIPQIRLDKFLFLSPCPNYPTSSFFLAMDQKIHLFFFFTNHVMSSVLGQAPIGSLEPIVKFLRMLSQNHY